MRLKNKILKNILKTILSVYTKTKNKTGLFLTFKNIFDYKLKLIHIWKDGSPVYWGCLFDPFIICCNKKAFKSEEGYFCYKCKRLVNVCKNCYVLYDKVSFEFDKNHSEFEEIEGAEFIDNGNENYICTVPYNYCFKIKNFLNDGGIFYHWECSKCNKKLMTMPD